MNLEAGRIVGTDPSSSPAPVRWQPARRTLRLQLYIALMLLDLLVIVGSFALGRTLYAPSGGQDWLSFIAVVAPVHVIVAYQFKAYSAEALQSAGRAVALGLKAFAVALGAVLLIAFFLKSSSEISRVAFSLGAMGSLIGLTFGRSLFVRRARAMLGGTPYTTVLITDGVHPQVDGDYAIIIPTDTGLDPSNQAPEMYDRLASMLRHADRVVVACLPERRSIWAHMLKGVNVRSEILSPELEAFAPLHLSRWGTHHTMVVADGPLGRVDSCIKRAFDVVVASVALIVTAPVLLVVAALVKFGSEGPVFFVQTRIGEGNRMFQMLKFRSMRAAASDGAGNRSTGRDDDRITPIGAIIRKTSIDELPQLINVLRGDMSIVGPRPHALGSRAAEKLFWEVDGRYWHRHAAKPGLTGLAQVRGFRGATALESDLTNRLQADLEYLLDWSIWRDLKIIAMTFRVLVHRNAF